MAQNFYENKEVVELSRKYEQNLVHLCVTSLVEELSSMFYYVESLKHEADKVGYQVNHRHLKHNLHQFTGEHNGLDVSEVASWWVVDNWLANQLSNRGEAVLDTPIGYVWGRTSGGQAIHIDDIMLEIANDAIL